RIPRQRAGAGQGHVHGGRGVHLAQHGPGPAADCAPGSHPGAARPAGAGARRAAARGTVALSTRDGRPRITEVAQHGPWRPTEKLMIAQTFARIAGPMLLVLLMAAAPAWGQAPPP